MENKHDPIYGKILSIQSHVVSGYVGNKAAVFPLQLLGYDVDVMNTVQFATHSGYKIIKGYRYTPKQMEELAQGLAINEKDTQYDYILTGYIANPEAAETLSEMIKNMQKKNKNTYYCCDPVLGDNGRYYVPQTMKEAFLKLLKQATITTPNSFEASALTNITFKSEENVYQFFDFFKKNYPQLKIVVLTSIDHFTNPKLLNCYASNGETIYKITFPKIDGGFTGTGDLVAAVFLGWYHRENCLKSAIEKTIAVVQHVLSNTIPNGELKLIQCRTFIPNPIVTHHAVDITPSQKQNNQ